ncbi:BPTD_3080 family restriction endonuclease [Streptomyces sp. SAS_270]|uniref:BPTD_3080 family restriction endonuclease n=1 Tax=Streptomyces sp. SAS_270 TaxID=3412748 RepID=UPI00403D23F8
MSTATDKPYGPSCQRIARQRRTKGVDSSQPRNKRSQADPDSTPTQLRSCSGDRGGDMTHGAAQRRVIENPILNSPYRAPERYFAFDTLGITDTVIERRRPSSHFIPVPRPRKSSGSTQQELPGFSEADIRENELVNGVRRSLDRWRAGGRPNITPTTRRLLEYWTDSSRDNPVLYCQLEAAETAIYIAEAATKCGDPWIRNELDAENTAFNAGLPRIALKMATGTGKTVVMAMLIAWQVLNKAANPNDRKFTRRFLLVTPGITIRDRLRVLLPDDPENYYRERDLVPADLVFALRQARIAVVNFHTLRRRDRTAVGKVTRLNAAVLQGDSTDTSAFVETQEAMVRRVCADLRGSGEIMVLNDEAHHCYLPRAAAEAQADRRVAAAEQREAEARDADARVWFSGLAAIHARLGIKTVYDLSATPFFIGGSGYGEGDLFSWVVSDFSLVDAIESGVVKIPRVPVDDDRPSPDVTYLDLWQRIREGLPRQGRKADATHADVFPDALDGALASLYSSYKREYARWEESGAATAGEPPPVFIVVCANTAVSKMVFDRIAGHEKVLKDGTAVLVPGSLELFSNVQAGTWSASPPTILIDSRELESGEALSKEFRRLAAAEIEEFKAEYTRRFPGRSEAAVSDADLLREVMNTVGKPGRLGAGVRCVVSVSMLTEGWDANTVTHILGVRAFGTQLLCEQVVGRGLRRRSYAADENGFFAAEYADVYGVPFQFIPTVGRTKDLKRKPVHRVRAEPDRQHAEITFPCLSGYRQEFPEASPEAEFGPDSRMVLSKRDLPMLTETAGLVGSTDTQSPEAFLQLRDQQVAFRLAAEMLTRLDDSADPKPWHFPAMLKITRGWISECLELQDDTRVGLVTSSGLLQEALARIRNSLRWPENSPEPKTVPIFQPHGSTGSTQNVNFATTKQVYVTAQEMCHVNFTVLDGASGNSWERSAAQALETHRQVVEAYVKNDHLGFAIPYTHQGSGHRYLPDFLVRLKPTHDGVPRTLILEISGGRKSAAVTAVKADAARNLWLPAVNGHGGFGLWGFCEVTDPTRVKQAITEAAQALEGRGGSGNAVSQR